MNKVYLIQDFDTKLFLDWYHGIFSLTEDINGRNVQFPSKKDAENSLTERIVENIKADIDNIERLQIIEIIKI